MCVCTVWPGKKNSLTYSTVQYRSTCEHVQLELRVGCGLGRVQISERRSDERAGGLIRQKGEGRGAENGGGRERTTIKAPEVQFKRE